MSDELVDQLRSAGLNVYRAGEMPEPTWREHNEYPERFRSWAALDLTFAINYNRYGYSLGHGYVAVCVYHDMDEAVREAVDELEGGDLEASDAMDWLLARRDKLWIGCHPNPVKAVEQCVDQAYSFWEAMDRKQHPHL